MKRLIDIGVVCARAAVVAGVILALVVSGAGAAQRLFAEQCLQRLDETPSNSITLDSKPDPRETTGGMTPGSRPWTEQSFWVQSNLALPAGGDQLKGRITGALAASGALSHDPHVHHAPTVCNSPCLVASQIGHRFTLVGARPSGTS